MGSAVPEQVLRTQSGPLVPMAVQYRVRHKFPGTRRSGASYSDPGVDVSRLSNGSGRGLPSTGRSGDRLERPRRMPGADLPVVGELVLGSVLVFDRQR